MGKKAQNIFIVLILYTILMLSIYSHGKISVQNTDKKSIIEINYKNLGFPLDKKYNITSDFGSRINPASGRKSFHSGVDFGAPRNSNLYAITDGTIVFSGFKGPYRIYYYIYRC